MLTSENYHGKQSVKLYIPRAHVRPGNVGEHLLHLQKPVQLPVGTWAYIICTQVNTLVHMISYLQHNHLPPLKPYRYPHATHTAPRTTRLLVTWFIGYGSSSEAPIPLPGVTGSKEKLKKLQEIRTYNEKGFPRYKSYPVIWF